jgi:uncharacterized protein YjiK
MKSQFINFKIKWLVKYFKITRLTFFSLVIFSFSFCISSNGKKVTEQRQKVPINKTDSLLLAASDSSKYNIIDSAHSNGSLLYDLENPDERYLLPKYLIEISGLSYYKEDRILCEQDEKAEIYVLSMDKKEIISKYVFGKKGDFEDIAVIKQTVYMLRSDGRIFRIENFEKENRKVKEYKTPLSSKNNTEGLVYDRTSNSLLIACKGSPAIEKDKPHKGYKAIYRYDLGEMKLDKKPEFLIDINSADSYRDVNLLTRFKSDHDGKLQPEESETGFHPSGIAINPVNDQIYIISSAGKILVIIDRKGKILDLHALDPEIFVQPEGICFSPSGDLFISSEGKEGKGYVLKFKLRRNQ